MAEKSDFLRRLKRYRTNFIIGVAGDSGSGKTTFTNGIRRLLTKDLVCSFSLDDYHTEDRATRKRSGNMALDPKINNLSLLAEHLRELKKGNAVVKPVYDHSTGTFAPDEVFEPTSIIIVEGLHTFYTQELRDIIDFGIFVDPEREVKWLWKMKRDVEERGHEKEDVIKSIRKREPLYKRFLDFQKIYTDILVKIRPSKFEHESGVAVELIQEVSNIPLKAIDLHFDLSNLLRASERNFALEFKCDYYYGKPVSRIMVDGEIGQDAILGLEGVVREFTGLYDTDRSGSQKEYTDSVGLAQLLICWRYLEKMDYILQDVERVIG